MCSTSNLADYASNQGFNEGRQIDAIYTDASKAFDHTLFLKKLKGLGLHGNLEYLICVTDL